MARRNRCRCNHSPRGGGQNRKKMKILNRYSKPNSRRHEPGCGRIRGVPPGYIFLFAASCLAMSSCTWEEFPDEPAVLQKPVALSFATAVETAPEADTSGSTLSAFTSTTLTGARYSKARTTCRD